MDLKITTLRRFTNMKAQLRRYGSRRSCKSENLKVFGEERRWSVYEREKGCPVFPSKGAFYIKLLVLLCDYKNLVIYWFFDYFLKKINEQIILY